MLKQFPFVEACELTSVVCLDPRRCPAAALTGVVPDEAVGQCAAAQPLVPYLLPPKYGDSIDETLVDLKL